MFFKLDSIDRPALTIGNSSLSFRDLNCASDHLAQSSIAKLNPQIIVLNSRSSFNFVIKLLAIWKAGKIACVISNHYSQSVTQDCLATLPGYALLDSEQNHILSLREGITHLPKQAALILFTSGSSGHPKAVVLSRENIEANMHAVQESLNFSDVVCQDLNLPLSYSFGLCGQLFPALVNNVNTYLHEDIGGVLRSIKLPRTKLMLSGVPEQLSFLAQLYRRFPSACSRVSHVVTAGAPLSVKQRGELLQTFSKATIFTNYGMTECSPRVLCLSSRDPLFLEGGSGYPVPGIKTQVSQEGELIISGKQVMLGYLEDQRLIFPNSFASSSRNFYSGDKAKIKDGLHYILGRKDKQIKVSGVKINCQHINRVYENHPNVEKACSIPISCDTYGQRVVVFAVPKLKNLSTNLIVDELRPQLPHQAAVKNLIFLSEWPMTPHGKTDQKILESKIKEEYL